MDKDFFDHISFKVLSAGARGMDDISVAERFGFSCFAKVSDYKMSWEWVVKNRDGGDGLEAPASLRSSYATSKYLESICFPDKMTMREFISDYLDNKGYSASIINLSENDVFALYKSNGNVVHIIAFRFFETIEKQIFRPIEEGLSMRRVLESEMFFYEGN